jgi:anti-sigma-K factor RskA
MSAIDHERADALAALNAAGAATAEEIQELNALCAQSSEIAELVRLYEEAATALAQSLPLVEAPPAALDAIRRRIVDGPAVGGTVSVISLDERRARASDARQRWPQIMAALAAAAALALGVLWTRERQSAADLRAHVAEIENRSQELSSRLAVERRQRAAIETELASTQRRVEHIQSPSLQLATLRASDAPASEAPRAPSAKVFIDPENRRWLVLAYDLPVIDPTRQDYQLWFIPRIEGSAPMPAGLLAHTGDGVYEAAIEVPSDVDVAQAAISLEKKGGVAVPTDVKMAGPII